MKTLLILLTFALALAIPVLGNTTSYVDELVMFDQYLFQDRLKTKRQRLENLSAALRERPSETVYIVAFGAPKGSNCESVPELRFVRNYLVDVLRVNPRRFVLIDGGIGKVARTEFYLLPSDAIFPEDSIRYRINDVLNPDVSSVSRDREKPATRNRPFLNERDRETLSNSRKEKEMKIQLAYPSH